MAWLLFFKIGDVCLQCALCWPQPTCALPATCSWVVCNVVWIKLLPLGHQESSCKHLLCCCWSFGLILQDLCCVLGFTAPVWPCSTPQLDGSQLVPNKPRVQKACVMAIEWKCVGLFEWLQWLGCCSLQLVTFGSVVHHCCPDHPLRH